MALQLSSHLGVAKAASKDAFSAVTQYQTALVAFLITFTSTSAALKPVLRGTIPTIQIINALHAPITVLLAVMPQLAYLVPLLFCFIPANVSQVAL